MRIYTAKEAFAKEKAYSGRTFGPLTITDITTNCHGIPEGYGMISFIPAEDCRYATRPLIDPGRRLGISRRSLIQKAEGHP